MIIITVAVDAKVYVDGVVQHNFIRSIVVAVCYALCSAVGVSRSPENRN